MRYNADVFLGPIEKGANDGQLGYGNNLIQALKAGVAPKARKMAPKPGAKGKTRRVKTTVIEADARNAAAAKANQAKAPNWGLFEPLRGPLSPIVDIFGPFWNSNVAVVVLSSLLFMMWLRTPSTQPKSHGLALHHLSAPERLLAYDELWAKEESELWDWLEDRVGMEGLTVPVVNTEKLNSKREKQLRQQRRRDHRDAEARLRDEKMSEREITDAIRVTQQRLETLQQVVERRRHNREQAEDERRR